MALLSVPAVPKRMKPTRNPFAQALSAASCFAVLLVAHSAQAESLYWDLNDYLPNDAIPATGDWDGDINFYWSRGSSGTGTQTRALTTSADDLIFSSGSVYTAGTITVSNPAVASSVTFEDDVALRLSGETVTVGGTGAHSGILVLAGNHADNLVDAALALGANATIQTAGSGVLTISGGITGAHPLVLKNNSSNATGITISGVSLNNEGSVTNSGTGSGGTLISSVIGTNVTGVIQNSPKSSLTLSGTSTYAGATTISAGVLNLSGVDGKLTGTSAVTVSGGTFNEGDTLVDPGVADRVNTASALTLGGTNGGGNFNLLRGSTTPGSQSFASLTVASGLSSITGGSSIDNTAPTLTFSGTTPYVRNVGGLVNITDSNVKTTFTSKPDGSGNVAGTGTDTVLIGATLNGVDFIKAAAGDVAAAVYTATGTTPWTGGKNMDVTDTNPVPYGPSAVNSLRFNTEGANTVTLAAGTNHIASGMILVTGNVGDHASTITGGTITGASGTDLLVINNNTTGAGSSLTIGSVIDNNTSGTALTKAGAGSLILTGANTYTGGTIVRAGTLVVNNTADSGTGTGAILVASGATLKGTGTIGTGAALVTIESGGTYSPGNSPGLQTINGDLDLNSGSIFEWDLTASTNAAGDRGTLYDGVDVKGALTGSGAVFKVVLGSYLFSDPFWSSTRTWSNIISAGSGNTLESIFGSFGGVWVASSGFVAGEGTFRFSDNTLEWDALPEPSTALAGLLLGAGLLRRRR